MSRLLLSSGWLPAFVAEIDVREATVGCLCESLETRRLYAGIHLEKTILVIGGWPVEPNTITVGLSPDGSQVEASLSFPTPKSGVKGVSTAVPLSRVQLVYIVGGKAADLITVDQTNGPFPVPCRILSSDGNDTVLGGDEPDTIIGGIGTDFLDGGAGNDRIYGEYGNDTIIGGPGDDALHGGRGVDLVDGSAGTNDTIIAGHGNDTLLGGSGVNTFYTMVASLKSDVENYRPHIDHLHNVTIPPKPSDNSLWDELSQWFSWF